MNKREELLWDYWNNNKSVFPYTTLIRVEFVQPTTTREIIELTFKGLDNYFIKRAIYNNTLDAIDDMKDCLQMVFTDVDVALEENLKKSFDEAIMNSRFREMLEGYFGRE